MIKKILAVTANVQFPDIIGEAASDFQLVNATSIEAGVDALQQHEDWCLAMVDLNFGASNALSFLRQVNEETKAITILLGEEEDLGNAVHLANEFSIFRILPLDCTQEECESVLNDAARQYTLIFGETQLHKRIEALTVTDPLTNCYNRNYLQNYLAKELLRARRYSHNLSLIICDIDALRHINDSYGHHSGDAVLKGLPQLAGQIVRNDIDTISRWGEDEFIIILPETPIRGAGVVAERLRKSFAEKSFSVSGPPISCTASFGVAGYAPEIPDRNRRLDDLLTIADRCLIQSKAAGGNQVLCCP